jgi:hypothetical protein
MPFKQYMRNLVDSGKHVFFVEHTKNDRQWADGADGSGMNMLGKLLTQVFLEVREGQELTIDQEFLSQPNTHFVLYS